MAHDKKLHLGAGVVIAVLVGVALHEPLYGLPAAIVAGMLKECRDWCSYKNFDEKDALATWLGGLLGTLVMEAVSWIF